MVRSDWDQSDGDTIRWNMAMRLCDRTCTYSLRTDSRSPKTAFVEVQASSASRLCGKLQHLDRVDIF